MYPSSRQLAWTALAACAALLAACRGIPNIEPAPPVREVPPGSPTVTVAPPLAEVEREFGIEGTYQLTQIGDSVIPASVSVRPGCTVQVLTGSLALQEGGFSVAATTREGCGGAAAGRTRNAQGRYTRDGADIRFTVTGGGPVRAAQAQTLGDSSLLVTAVETAGGTRAVQWRFRREPTVPLPPPGG